MRTPWEEYRGDKRNKGFDILALRHRHVRSARQPFPLRTRSGWRTIRSEGGGGGGGVLATSTYIAVTVTCDGELWIKHNCFLRISSHAGDTEWPLNSIWKRQIPSKPKLSVTFNKTQRRHWSLSHFIAIWNTLWHAYQLQGNGSEISNGRCHKQIDNINLLDS
jgi:hypothetical protein